jgi:hypothetical protein
MRTLTQVAAIVLYRALDCRHPTAKHGCRAREGGELCQDEMIGAKPVISAQLVLIVCVLPSSNTWL